MTGVQATHFVRTAEGAEANSCSITSSRKEPLQGWTLKAQKKGQRATKSVKIFLLEKFNKEAKKKW